ncbi:hypothetical protein [Paenibacillus shenyangensis]|uniref:hypothetical protein n=1 Tax=Paenibacillus sp. A9 TaxID=1284352 RepID=UPI000373379C|nr:hypothetical protein [Paenibacillus sp. A9]
MKKVFSAATSLIFLFPVILLSVMVWRDYTGQLNEAPASARIDQVKDVFFADQGHTVIGITDRPGNDHIVAYTYDADSHRYEGTLQLPSDMFKQTAASYQQDDLILAVKDANENLLAYRINSKEQPQQIYNRSSKIDDYLEWSTREWRGRLIFFNASADPAPKAFYAQIHNGQLHYIDLNDGSYFQGQRPTTITDTSSVWDEPGMIPMFEVTLADKTKAYISGILDDNNQLDVYYHPERDEPFDAEDHAQTQFRKHFGGSTSTHLAVETDYPEQVYAYNNNDDKIRLLSTPKPVYAARMFLLNDEEVLIAGSTAKDPVKGTRTGYIYNEQSRQFTNVTKLLGSLGVDDLTSHDLHFYKPSGQSLLYYSYIDHSAGMIDTSKGNVNLLTTDEVTSWQQNTALTAADQRPSVQSFISYVKEWNALIINWLVWLFITVIMFLIVPVLIKILTLRRRKQLEQGILLQAKILSMEETGTRINDQPLIRFLVGFTHEGRSEQTEIRQVVSYLNMPKSGDPVMISYNPVTGKALFVTENDRQNNNLPSDEPETIPSAMLRKIDSYGPVNRGEALLLHFEAAGQSYRVPVVQSPGFLYRIGDIATLLHIGGTTRMFRYGESTVYRKQDHTALQGRLIHLQKYPVHIDGRQLMLLELVTESAHGSVTRLNSQFVPQHMIEELQPGIQIPVSVKLAEYEREAELLRGRQGSAIVRSVQFHGTTGERPLATIIAERKDVEYRIEQSIEPLYGVMEGDELWIAYNEQRREAVIVKYASAE